jgi:hypothetical protein
MDTEFLEAITKSLNAFAAKKFAAKKFDSAVYEMKGPTQEGASYRWRLITSRHKEITVLLVAKKHFLGKATADRFEVYGVDQTKILKPDLADLQAYLNASAVALTN